MEGKGWASGEGLGRHGQGIVDAIKPKLKFDQAGMGHNRSVVALIMWKFLVLFLYEVILMVFPKQVIPLPL